jgi:hypothetical protein
MANKVIYGKGEKSKFTASSFLEAAGLEEYKKFIGNGLNIGGLNMGTDKDFRIAEGSETLDVMAPETDMVTVELEFDEVEVDRPAKTPEYQAEQLAKEATEATKE